MSLAFCLKNNIVVMDHEKHEGLSILSFRKPSFSNLDLKANIDNFYYKNNSVFKSVKADVTCKNNFCGVMIFIVNFQMINMWLLI